MAGLPKHIDEIIEEHEEAEFTRRPRTVDDEMDITPMIDITFLLLIFFLVTSTPDDSTAIDLPEAQHGAAVSQIECTIFTIADGGLQDAPVYAADGKIDAAKLSEDADERKKQIKTAVEEGMDSTPIKTSVLIKADKSVKCREVDNVIKAVSKVDGVKLHLAILTDG
ncbi:MAG: biopolymer transporter ExbD [Planctomycetota bacterium]